MPNQREQAGNALDFVDDNETRKRFKRQLRFFKQSGVPWVFQIEELSRFKLLGQGSLSRLAWTQYGRDGKAPIRDVRRWWSLSRGTMGES